MNCYGNLNKRLVGREFLLLERICNFLTQTMFLSHTRTFRAFRNLTLWYKVDNYVDKF